MLSSTGKFLRNSKIFLASAAIAFTFLGTSAVIKPVEVSAQSVMAQRMYNLKNSQQRWIEINLSSQRLIAWQGGKAVFAATVSTGKAATPTYPGVFSIQRKLITDRMRGADYDVPNVPYTMYYYGGYAIHGAYWHNRFGTPVSHGCTNMRPKDAQFVYNFAAVGTPVVIHY
ncbi:MAG: L,D-transpeptidase [Prochloraceae cyanobacterium]|nr:L,D-transpeptidase [Prochloraceae cyanobacterium]